MTTNQQPESLIVIALASLPITIPLAAMLYELARIGRRKGDKDDEGDNGTGGQ